MIEKKDCIDCNACTKHCKVLEKHQLKLSDKEELEKIAYHCFLCEKCNEVCPAGMNGKDIFLSIRREQVKENGGKVVENGYEMLIKEKEDYIFQNYKNAASGTVLFTGCSFPSFFPKTTRYLVNLLKEKYGIGTIYDCCGKPISELGMEVQEEQIVNRIKKKMEILGVTEVIMLCPNCYYFLKEKLGVKVTGVFEFLWQKGIGKKLFDESLHLFVPCPDKRKAVWLQQVENYLPDNIDLIDEIPCCGLGGCARGKEPEISRGFTEKLIEKKYPSIYTYCSSCAGKFGRDQMKNIHHVLSDILGIEEQPDVKNSMTNREKSKNW